MAPTAVQAPRVSLALEVEFATQAVFAQAWTHIPSAAGMFLCTPLVLPLGSRVKLLLTCPGLLEPLRADAEVVQVQAPDGEVPAGLYVKLWPDGKVGQEPPRAPPPPPTRRSFRVLLVDDNPHTLQMYAHALKRLGRELAADVQVESAPHGQDAVERLARDPPVDLMISDIYMPVMDGLTLLQKLRADPRLAALPVLIISGGDHEAMARAAGLGAQAFIEKPVQIQTILDTVKGLLHLVG